ncbi:hypothetical protein TNIN_146601 [Trichonephila inaurata madagascariensis]|uniref:Uncharacterized protein n=1 Tax=Trichonephila inaurata madagascariensis TaxID=2747483 RepID=A0A8X7C7I9_9ARAC|nr:hypothetical protein TNIN_146601 [Trichonephila inaurata madagascariensis]
MSSSGTVESRTSEIAACEKLRDTVTGISAFKSLLDESLASSPTHRNSFSEIYRMSTQAMAMKKGGNEFLASIAGCFLAVGYGKLFPAFHQLLGIPLSSEVFKDLRLPDGSPLKRSIRWLKKVKVLELSNEVPEFSQTPLVRSQKSSLGWFRNDSGLNKHSVEEAREPCFHHRESSRSSWCEVASL